MCLGNFRFEGRKLDSNLRVRSWAVIGSFQDSNWKLSDCNWKLSDSNLKLSDGV